MVNHEENYIRLLLNNQDHPHSCVRKEVIEWSRQFIGNEVGQAYETFIEYAHNLIAGIDHGNKKGVVAPIPVFDLPTKILTLIRNIALNHRFYISYHMWEVLTQMNTEPFISQDMQIYWNKVGHYWK